MGVDFYNCDICEEIFSDAGYYGHCINCESMMCGSCHDKMTEKYGQIGEDHDKSSWYGEEATHKCSYCDGTVIDDGEFINFLASKIGKTLNELKDEFRSK